MANSSMEGSPLFLTKLKNLVEAAVADPTDFVDEAAGEFALDGAAQTGSPENTNSKGRDSAHNTAKRSAGRQNEE